LKAICLYDEIRQEVVALILTGLFRKYYKADEIVKTLRDVLQLAKNIK